MATLPKTVRSEEDEVVLLCGTYDAQGTSAATLITGGDGITTVDQTGTGLYLITLANEWTEFVGMSITLGAATPANIAGHTVAMDQFVPGSGGVDTIPFSVYNAADALHDLVTTEEIHVMIYVRGPKLS